MDSTDDQERHSKLWRRFARCLSPGPDMVVCRLLNSTLFESELVLRVGTEAERTFFFIKRDLLMLRHAVIVLERNDPYPIHGETW